MCQHAGQGGREGCASTEGRESKRGALARWCRNATSSNLGLHLSQKNRRAAARRSASVILLGSERSVCVCVCVCACLCEVRRLVRVKCVCVRACV